MANVSVFDFWNYKEFLDAWIAYHPEQRHGMRTAMAKAMGCQPTFVSQVLGDKGHLNLEQAQKLGRFLMLNQLESHALLLLVQFARAGTPALRDYFRAQVDETRKKALQLKSVVRTDGALSESARQTYYSAWYYAAIHVIVSIPRFQTVKEISRRLRLKPTVVAEVLRFLKDEGLVVQKQERFEMSTRSIHLPHDSPLIARHHANWRVQAMADIQGAPQDEEETLNYSSVVTLSRTDARRVRRRLFEEIQDIKGVIAQSPGEALYCFSVDFFEPVGAEVFP